MSVEYSELGDISKIIDSLHRTPQYTKTGYSMVRCTDVKYGILDLTQTLCVDALVYQDFSRRYQPSEDDILITRVGTYGVTARVKNTAFCMGQNISAIVPLNIDSRYLFFALNSNIVKAQIEAGVVGSTQKTLSLKVINKLMIPRLGSSIEKKLGEILGAFDDYISLLHETNTTLESIAKALFKSWFIDFDPVHAKAEGREPEGMDVETAAFFPRGFYESELGLIPTGWNTSSMNEISDVGIGKTPPRKETKWFSEKKEDIRWASIKDMGIAGVFISLTNEYLTPEAIERYNVRLVPDNTVILSFKMTIGRVALTDGLIATNEAIAHFKLNKISPLTSEYIYLHLKQFNYTTLSSTSSIADAVNSKTVKCIPILVPDSAILAIFQNHVEIIFKQIKRIEQQIHTIISLRDKLLPRLISGHLYLEEVDDLVNVV